MQRFLQVISFSVKGFLLITFVLASSRSWGGFFEMPEITEMPDLERKSMLKDLNVPSVRDRDPDPNSGPRLNVLKFKLEGIVEYPELGITKAEIDELIESIRYDLMQEYNVQESGFTQKELEDVSKLLVEIEEETTDRHVTELEVQKLIWLVRDQRSNRGVTLGTIETVADRITRYYRERGFILAKAYIPQQEVRDGIVTLTLLLGALGDVEVSGNELYDANYISATFDEWLSKPVTSSVTEENLYLINDFPGIAATGFFQPGRQVGDTLLNITVRAEQPYEVNFRMDNHGSDQTGEYRFYAEGIINNPLGTADKLELATLLTASPDNTVYGQLRYSSRLLSPRFKLSAGYSSNDFSLGAGSSSQVNDLQLAGSTEQYDVTATYSFKRSRANNFIGELKYNEVESVIRSEAVSGGIELPLGDTVANLWFTFRFDVLDEENKFLHQGDVSLISGKFKEGAEQAILGEVLEQDTHYSIFEVNYSLLTFWKIPYFNSDTRLIYRTALQYASSSLSSINQFSLAGPTRARGYSVNQFSADNAVYMGVDWIFNAPGWFDMQIGKSNLNQMVNPSIFLDMSYGESISLNLDEKDASAELTNVGIGFQFSYLKNIRGNLQLAFPVHEDFSSQDITVDDENVRLVFDFQYNFL